MNKDLEKQFHKEGYNIEITIFEDHDPDVAFRFAEALEGWSGIFEGDYRESIYIERIRKELQKSFPTLEYFVSLHSETIQIARLIDGKRRPRFLLASPELGGWILEQWKDGDWVLFGYDLSFLESLRALLACEEKALKGH